MTDTSESPAADVRDTLEPSPLARYLQAAGFVALWIAIGVALRLSGRDFLTTANAYLLCGVPLVILFQRFVRREPLVALWVRRARQLDIGVVGLAVGTALAVTPAIGLVSLFVQKSPGIVIPLWYGAAIVGAFGAGFCIRHTSLRRIRKGLPGFLLASCFGLAIMALAAWSSGHAIFPRGRTLLLVQQFLLYFPVCFVVEEVAFRGLLDAHVQPHSTGGWSKWLSAAFVSLLWGAWHLPIVPYPNPVVAVAVVISTLVVHTLLGMPLSFCWRGSGSLLLPCAAHALVDAFRNAVMM